jgi:hypothetical protein
MDSVFRFVRSRWQPILVALLALVWAGQLVSWGYAALQMHSIDGLVTAAQEDPPAREPEGFGFRGNPGRGRGSAGQEPKADLFFRRNPSYILTAIYKDQAVIDGRTVKAGDRIEKATVETILLSSVMIQEDGQSPRELKMFQGSGDSGGGPGMGRGRGGRGGRMRGMSSAQGAPPAAVSGEQPSGAPQFSREGISSEGRTQMREMFMRMRDGTMNLDELPPEMRERAEAMMARRAEMGSFGGRQGRGRGGF